MYGIIHNKYQKYSDLTHNGGKTSSIRLFNQLKLNSKINWSTDSEEKIIHNMIKNSQHLEYFCEELIGILKHTNDHEIIALSLFEVPYIIIEVYNMEWGHSPCASRALITWDFTNGRFASNFSKKKICYASHEWKEIIEDIVGYKIGVTFECKDKGNKKSCLR